MNRAVGIIFGIVPVPLYGDTKGNEMRRWRVKCVKAHKLPCGHEIQNDVLHCGNNKTKRADGINRRLFSIFLHFAESIFSQTIDFFENILYNGYDRKNYKSDFRQKCLVYRQKPKIPCQ